jgi:hypothetical protein
MNSSLLQSNQSCFEFGSLYKSNLSLDDSINLLENSEEENTIFFPLTNRTINENEVYQESPFSGKEHSDNKNMSSPFNNELEDKNIDSYDQFNSINNFNENCMNLNPISILTTSNNSFSFPNIGVKKEEIILDSEKDINTISNKVEEKIFKCDFLEDISLSLDENNLYNNSKNKKNKLDLNDPTSLFAAIVNLMKEKGPIETRTIISSLESKKDVFRKTNGSRYKQEFSKLIRTTLNNNPELFYKEQEGNKYYFIENKTKYYLEKKRERALEKVLFNLKKKNTFLPVNTKIQLDKVNIIIKRMEKKYKDDKKYTDVMICINLFKNLINKYLFLVKMDKVNSLYELTILNDKIIDICHTLEKIEKGELFFKKDDNIIVNKPNEYNDKNSRNIMFVEGANNHFNEPPDNI